MFFSEDHMRFISLAFIIALAGCPKTETTTPPTPTENAPAPIAPRVEGPMGPLLEAYDDVQKKLAADDLAGAQAAAEKLSSSATAATKTDIAGAADKIKSATDIGAARTAFGDVSKALITIVSADPNLQQGRYLFMCPMAKGYQKWVQTSDKLRNPYFGKEMLECGEQLKTWGA
jgi:hypothetical protein